MNVYFDHARVRSYPEHLNSWIEGQSVAFQYHRHAEMRGCIFDRCYEIQVIGNILQRRQEDEKLAVARL
jgi:hypothetical protein